jgi:hypothetical protein
VILAVLAGSSLGGFLGAVLALRDRAPVRARRHAVGAPAARAPKASRRVPLGRGRACRPARVVARRRAGADVGDRAQAPDGSRRAARQRDRGRGSRDVRGGGRRSRGRDRHRAAAEPLRARGIGRGGERAHADHHSEPTSTRCSPWLRSWIRRCGGCSIASR